MSAKVSGGRNQSHGLVSRSVTEWRRFIPSFEGLSQKPAQKITRVRGILT